MKQNLFVHGGSALVSKVTCDGSLRESIERSVELIGGLDWLVKRGDTILLKPNCNTADPFPGSSDPGFVKAVIEMLFDAGAEKVILGERTAFLHNRRVLERAGIVKMADEAGAEVRVFGRDGWNTLLDRQGWRRIGVPGGQYLRRVALAREALEIQKIVYLPLIKTHHAADFTGSIKLSMGFVKPFFDQMAFHLRYLREKLAELGLVVRPDLIIMDARKVFIKGGPAKGELREPNLVLASGNQITIDVEGVKILQSYQGNSLEGRNPWKLTQIAHAVKLGLGPHNEDEYKVIVS
ncbi:MAG TPA: DUF362 domain-containing protein [candidate division Zixibacteria bacterium]|nr:DUF362 domain-containing protein [candidate division Zixibacteria bacterium]